MSFEGFSPNICEEVEREASQKLIPPPSNPRGSFSHNLAPSLSTAIRSCVCVRVRRGRGPGGRGATPKNFFKSLRFRLSRVFNLLSRSLPLAEDFSAPSQAYFFAG